MCWLNLRPRAHRNEPTKLQGDQLLACLAIKIRWQEQETRYASGCRISYITTRHAALTTKSSPLAAPPRARCQPSRLLYRGGDRAACALTALSHEPRFRDRLKTRRRNYEHNNTVASCHSCLCCCNRASYQKTTECPHIQGEHCHRIVTGQKC